MAELDEAIGREEQLRDELLRAHEELRRTYRRFLAASAAAFSGFASCIARRLLAHDDNESCAIVVVLLSLAATLLSALDAREARLLRGRMHALLRLR